MEIDRNNSGNGEQIGEDVQGDAEGKAARGKITSKHRVVRRMLAVLVLVLGIAIVIFGILVLLTLPQPPVSGIVGDASLKGKGIVKPVPQEVLEKWGIHIEKVPDDENAAVNFKKAGEIFVDFDEYMGIASDIQRGKWDRLYAIKSHLWGGAWIEEGEELIPWIKANEPVIDELRKGAQKAKCQFQWFYDPAYTLTEPNVMPDVVNMVSVINFASLYFSYLVHQDKLAEAVELELDVMRTGVYLMGGTSSLEYITGALDQSIAFSILRDRVILQPDTSRELLHRILDETTVIAQYLPTTQKIIKIQGALDRVFLTDYYRGYIDLKVYSIPLSELLAIPIKEDEPPSPVRTSVVNLWGRMGLFFSSITYPLPQAIKDLNTYYDRAGELTALPINEALAREKELDDIIKGLKGKNKLITALFRFTIHNFQTYAKQCIDLNILVSMTALELYKRDKDDYPEKLEALIPDYLSAVPIDAASGKPLGYRLEKEGYLIWSVGSNLTDDNGTYECEGNWAKGPDYAYTNVPHKPRPFVWPPPGEEQYYNMNGRENTKMPGLQDN